VAPAAALGRTTFLLDAAQRERLHQVAAAGQCVRIANATLLGAAGNVGRVGVAQHDLARSVAA
jgi:hypothetical protein